MLAIPPHLLAVTPSPNLGDLVMAIMPYASLIFSIYVFWSNRNKEEDKLLRESIKKISAEVANHGMMHQAHQQERERLVDVYNQRFQQLEQRVSQVDQVLAKVTALEIRLEAQHGQLAKLESTAEKMLDKFERMNDKFEKVYERINRS